MQRTGKVGIPAQTTRYRGLRGAVELYRTGFRRSLPLAAIAALLLGLSSLLSPTPPASPDSLDALMQMDVSQLADPSQYLNAYTSPAALRADALAVLIYIWIWSALIVVLHAEAADAVVRATAAAGRALRASPSVLLGTLIWAIASVLFLLPLLLAGTSLAIAVLGVIVLLVPSIYLSGSWQFFLPLILVERLGAFSALRRSRDLTRGRWWVAARELTMSLILIGVLSMIGDAVVAAMPAGAHPGVTSLSWWAGCVENTLLLPMLPAALLSIYYTLQELHESRELRRL